jgi:hypothetical protein
MSCSVLRPGLASRRSLPLLSSWHWRLSRVPGRIERRSWRPRSRRWTEQSPSGLLLGVPCLSGTASSPRISPALAPSGAAGIHLQTLEKGTRDRSGVAKVRVQ